MIIMSQLNILSLTSQITGFNLATRRNMSKEVWFNKAKQRIIAFLN